MTASGHARLRMLAAVLLGRFVGSAKGVKAFGEISLATSEHRRIAQSKAARFGLAEFLKEIEKIGGLIGFERGHEFLIVETEGISCVQLYRSVFRSDAQIFFHHFMPLFLWARVPFARAQQGTNEQVLRLSRHDVGAILSLSFAFFFDVHRSFGHRQKRVRRFDVLGHLGLIQTSGHFLHRIEIGSDSPDQEVRAGAQTDGRITMNH